ncbi:elongation factor 3 [Alkalihalobacillus alcalophilus ATCC 27647 = CGMCC 1.3604]|uniref:Ribosome protection protein VmlR n=1 Tax=Alkalihalobacillus alcalophilus ATCC 27647 = CGMCC 1.3604 TaxID=1218173 RepID=J8TIE0_ALKAL|nr:ABC-F type ribosomal protection protein [Alkalihalobacillus alcalophilus]AFV25840.1 unknown transporter [Alkalihalobacillus alcalophilus ATCC 27647 = CGMCC 1.3604]KGA96933.1 elongation factor 3 [Alkalihalobacillus alcalophilus ATCC 27647 = CGMCC 1.3604]MED1562287.1 ABC-F type ribosomal protection protein [Alkalihalobacillus alcalophilus]THG88810.1 elongation factor 3 [Alkalihalobacillus alcalophilus ATCC 27647 = CGMCC 1.3604]
MKELLQLQNISYEINDQTIFEKVNTNIQQGDIIGIIGKNGAGKSTLLQLLNRDLVPTTGQIKQIQNHLKITIVEQETESHSFDNITNQEEILLKKWDVPVRVYAQLSGGEKLKARLARGLAKETALLLLDEPTNHLDQQSLDFLTKQLKSYHGTVILVSHDRYFLDEVATKIWSIEHKKVYAHTGNYSSYMEAREQKRLTQQREYEKQQKMVERIEGQMNQLTSWAQSGHAQSTKKEGFKEYYRVKAKRLDSQVQSKQKRLEKELERIKAKPLEPEYEVHFSMESTHKVGKRFLEVKNLAKTFGKQTLFQNVHFTIQHGEKVSVTGPNGSGKTTFLKMIVGEETGEGDIWISPSAKIGYLTQEVFDLPLRQTPEQLFYQETFSGRGHVQNLMKHLGFSASQWTEPIQNMSMGERVKIKLMKYILEEKDVLILDEPTNHLDLPSREQLEDTLAQYTGTLLIVSHDRYFLEKTTDINLIFSEKGIYKQLNGNESSPKTNDIEELRLKLETERQEVLGKLSFISPSSKEYTELDQKFNELTKKIKELS